MYIIFFLLTLCIKFQKECIIYIIYIHIAYQDLILEIFFFFVNIIELKIMNKIDWYDIVKKLSLEYLRSKLKEVQN